MRGASGLGSFKSRRVDGGAQGPCCQLAALVCVRVCPNDRSMRFAQLFFLLLFFFLIVIMFLLMLLFLLLFIV